MTSLTPSALARLQWTQSRSRRCGWAVISIIVPGSARSLEHRLQIDLIPLAARQQPAGGVAEHRHARVAHRLDDAVRHLLARLLEIAVDARHHVVEARQQSVVEVEAAVEEDVALR